MVRQFTIIKTLTAPIALIPLVFVLLYCIGISMIGFHGGSSPWYKRLQRPPLAYPVGFHDFRIFIPLLPDHCSICTCISIFRLIAAVPHHNHKKKAYRAACLDCKVFRVFKLRAVVCVCTAFLLSRRERGGNGPILFYRRTA